jgi:nitrile hydratase subunit beta
VDTVADMGGEQSYGSVQLDPPDDPPFHEPWESRAWAMGVLSMRMSGTNLDAFRHALNRQHPIDYLAYGYFGRWLKGAENLLVDSSIIAPGAIDARARKLRGEDVEEPPVPEPHKPDYKPTAAGSLRQVDDPPRFAVGDRVRARDLHPAGHTRLVRYARGRTGVVRLVQPAHLLPDTNAHFLGENPQHVYNVAFESTELWGPDAEPFTLGLDLYESYLEAAPMEEGR